MEFTIETISNIHSGSGSSRQVSKWGEFSKHGHRHLWSSKKLLGHSLPVGGNHVSCFVFKVVWTLLWQLNLKFQLYRDPGLTVLVSNNSEPQPRWALDRLSPGHHYTARFHFRNKNCTWIQYFYPGHHYTARFHRCPNKIALKSSIIYSGCTQPDLDNVHLQLYLSFTRESPLRDSSSFLRMTVSI